MATIWDLRSSTKPFKLQPMVSLDAKSCGPVGPVRLLESLWPWRVAVVPSGLLC